MDTPDTLQELRERNYLALERPVSAVKGIGPGIQRHLTAMGIETVEGLIYHFPRRYLDRSQIVPIRQVRIGEDVTVVGTVRKVAERKTAQRHSLLQVSIYDGTAYLLGVWFNQSYHADRLKVGTEVAFSGKVQYRYNQLQITNPAYDVLNDPGEVGVDTVHTGRIIPLHPASQKLSTAVLRRLIKQALDTYGDLPDPLPVLLTERYHVPSHAAALRQIHFPTGLQALKEARRRMIYEELFILQTGLAIRRKRVREESVSVPHAQPGSRVEDFITGLPYRLTGAQQRSFQEIVEDMRQTHPMNRLLQGEVGSGKTLVALLALLLTVENGLQGAFMVPTEVLAEQHYATLSRMAEALPWLRFALLTSSTPEAERRRTLAAAGGGRTGHPGGHPLPHPAGRGLSRSRPGGYRRAAPLRGASAGNAEGKGRAPALSHHDRHPHPAHPRPHPLRRPGGVGAGRDAGGAGGDGHPGSSTRASGARLTNWPSGR